MVLYIKVYLWFQSSGAGLKKPASDMNDKFIKSFANVCYAISGYISTNTRKKQHFYTYFSENETISIKTRML